ncbi:MAG TPA: WxcM-like domain-containing protein [Anaerovoracaceae bacterium]|nr:WxcM-like domain-containing protein [Anaerovoracaceae bacterium]
MAKEKTKKTKKAAQKQLSSFEKFQLEKKALKNKAKGNEVITQDGVVTVRAKEQTEVSSRQSTQSTVRVQDGLVTVSPPKDSDQINVEPAKKVKTFDLDKKENGFLVELGKDGRLTTSYLSCALPGAFKGYHLHTVREANYVCVRGKIKVIMYTENGREEHVLSADKPERLHIPNNVPTGLSNEWQEEAWIVNSPDPAYDPELKGEQVEFTQEQCDRGEYLKK